MGWGDAGPKEDQGLGWKMKGSAGLWGGWVVLNPLLTVRAGVPGADPQRRSERQKRRTKKKKKNQPQTKRLDGLDGFPPRRGLSSALWGGGSLFMPEKSAIRPQKYSCFLLAGGFWWEARP